MLKGVARDGFGARVGAIRRRGDKHGSLQLRWLIFNLLPLSIVRHACAQMLKLAFAGHVHDPTLHACDKLDNARNGLWRSEAGS
jgi:hypothetical protein